MLFALLLLSGLLLIIPKTHDPLRLPRPLRQAIRLKLRVHHATTPTAAQLNELLDQLAACATRGHRIHLKVGGGYVVREAEVLGWYNQQVLVPISARDGGAPEQLLQ